MKKTLLAICALCMCIFFFHGCKKVNDPKEPAGFSFSDFVKSVSSSSFSNYQGKPGVKVKDETSFNEMKQYLLSRYEGVHVKQSFVGIDGQVVDCIPINEQPAARSAYMKDRQIQLKAPAYNRPAARKKDSTGKILPSDLRSIDITLKQGVKDKYGNEMFCPAGYIPVKRITLDILTRFATLDNFLGKSGFGKRTGNEPALYGDGFDHNHVVGRQNVDNAGGDSWLNVWSPSVGSGVFSLSQQWFTGGSGPGLQTIEGGWQVQPLRYSTNNACLFIYSTNANYSPGSGGYNLDNGAFVQVSNQVYFGAPFDHYSSTGGTQWGFNLQWKRNTDGNWWLFYKGPGDYIAVGYYPPSFYGSGQLSNFAQVADFGGEVAGAPQEGQMGSGAAGSAGWQNAAYQNQIFYILTSNIDQSAWAELSKIEENPACYTGDLHNIYGDWGTYLFFGGASCN